MFCSKCGTAIPEGALYCPKCGNGIANEERKDNNVYNTYLEIQGDYPLINSKFPLDLYEGEKPIYQYEVATLTGAGGTAVNGYITLTNRRILFNKKTTAKSFIGTGLLGVALAAGDKNVNILFSDIVSIEGKTIRMNKRGLEITTKDGYVNRFVFNKTAARDSIVELVKTVVK